MVLSEAQAVHRAIAAAHARAISQADAQTTAETATLRAAYERQQRITRTRLAVKIRRDFAGLDLVDLDASWPGYLRAALASIHEEWRVSTLDALLYLLLLMMAANNPPATALRQPTFDTAHVRNLLRLTGPVEIKRLIGNGWEPQPAKVSAGRGAVLGAQNHVTTEARIAQQEAAETATNSAGNRPVTGYRRIAKPTACSFCRRLAGATQHVGLVYNVTANWLVPHGNCQCEIEPVLVRIDKAVQHAADRAHVAQIHDLLRRQRDAALAEARRGLLAA